MLKFVRWFSNGKLLVVSYGENVRNAGFHGTQKECEDHIEMLREIALKSNLIFKKENKNELE